MQTPVASTETRGLYCYHGSVYQAVTAKWTIYSGSKLSCHNIYIFYVWSFIVTFALHALDVQSHVNVHDFSKALSPKVCHFSEAILTSLKTKSDANSLFCLIAHLKKKLLNKYMFSLNSFTYLADETSAICSYL